MTEVLEKKTAQDQCIEEHDGKWLVIAGPGTGKTYTVTERISNMIKGNEKHLPIAPSSILCLTFTETAAEEMKKSMQESKQAIMEKLERKRFSFFRRSYQMEEFLLLKKFHFLEFYVFLEYLP